MSESLETIISPDLQRSQRIPPRQVLTTKWPVLHYGATPTFQRDRWTFHIFGLVESPWECNYDGFVALPKIRVHADMHCVTRWSLLDNLWEGVATNEVLAKVRVKPAARFVMVHCEHGFSTNLPLEDFCQNDCLFAWRHNGQDLDPDHGYPLRLVVPRLYAWKSAKWVRGIELMAEDRPGFWEEFTHGGYHMRGDPWREERFRSDP